ncbi:LAGLIDADG family homing endonuclease [Priestia aryabhattai]|uniref:LAGLIDADG family homing endonuclease n=1 Tax=Priestia aryabhattai TaxID=412384 RepID=UPI001C8EF49A|nr:LAGLIDADG family homing endonuclease [Priestia aryabhattai]MBY0062367.1 hypothetical protein [Priestia aryabhattai]
MAKFTGKLKEENLELIKDLYLIKGKKVKEIAEVLGVSGNTVSRFMKKHGLEVKRCIPDNRMFNDNIEREICRLYDYEKYSVTQLATKFSSQEPVIYNVLRRNKIQMRKGGFQPKYTAEDVEKFNEMHWDLGLSLGDIAISVGLNRKSGTSISCAMRRHGFKVRSEDRRWEKWDTEYVKAWKDLYWEQAKSLSDIARIYSISAAQISRTFKRHGVETRSVSEGTRTYKLDDYAFNIIDSHEKAYWLGFIYADGCVSVRIDKEKEVYDYRLVIALQESDKQTLEDLSEFLKTDRPLLYKKSITRVSSNGKSYTSKPQYILNVFSKQMIEDLKNWGVVPRKSLIVTFPNSLSEEYYNSFILGYFDGDGSISCSNEKWQISLVGTKEFLERIQEILINRCGVSLTKLGKKKGQKSYSLRYGGAAQLKELGDWLYRDSPVFMARKKEKFLQIQVKGARRKSQKGVVQKRASKL